MYSRLSLHHQKVLLSRSFSSTNKQSTNNKTTSLWTRLRQNTSRPSYVIFARFVRYLRIPFLIISIYQLGYQAGIIAYAADPEHTERVLLQEVLAGVGCTDQVGKVQKIRDAEEKSWFSSPSSSVDAQRVSIVARIVLKAAILYVRQEREKAADNLHSQLPDDLSQSEYYALLLQDEEFSKWNDALKRLSGDWTYLIVSTDLPNAFVTVRSVEVFFRSLILLVRVRPLMQYLNPALFPTRKSCPAICSLRRPC